MIFPFSVTTLALFNIKSVLLSSVTSGFASSISVIFVYPLTLNSAITTSPTFAPSLKSLTHPLIFLFSHLNLVNSEIQTGIRT